MGNTPVTIASDDAVLFSCTRPLGNRAFPCLFMHRAALADIDSAMFVLTLEDAKPDTDEKVRGTVPLQATCGLHKAAWPVSPPHIVCVAVPPPLVLLCRPLA